MIQQIYIKNFKAFEKKSMAIEKNNVIIGENDAGKSTILQALNIFFNEEKIEKCYVRNTSENVEIGILYNDKFYKKVYGTTTYKLIEADGDVTELDDIKYIYIPVNFSDPKQIITQLAIAKAMSETSNEILDTLKEISQDSINSIIAGIDEELLVVNQGTTVLEGTQNMKYEAALKFNVSSNGIPIESRGSGFQKNLMYALLVGNVYDNVILGIDEIENSFSVNNTSNIINELVAKMGQTIITTHSKKVVEISTTSHIIPLFSEGTKTLAELLKELDKTDTKKYLLVEGKYDLPWFKKGLELISRSNDYIILPGGGDNVDSLKSELELLGKTCYIIRDGDTNDDNSLILDCIELYAPLDNLNSMLNLNLSEVPSTKEEFFDKTIISGVRNKDSVKRIIANRANDFLNNSNQLINEIETIINNFENN